jgi:uncharacterized protein YjiS (DUF1127 family)
MHANSLTLDRLFGTLHQGSAPLGFEVLPKARQVVLAWARAQWQLWQTLREARRLRQALAALDTGTLRDLGLSQHRHDALHDHRHGPWQRWQW